MKKLYEILFYEGEGRHPAYYVIDIIESEILGVNSDEKLRGIISRVRDIFHFGDDISSLKIQEKLFILHEDGLVPLSRGFSRS